MKKKFLGLFLPMVVMFFFSANVQSQDLIERKASESNALALFDFYQDFHSDFEAAAKEDIENSTNIAIPKFLDTYLGMYGLLDKDRVFAPDNVWLSTLVEANVMEDLNNLLGATGTTTREIDTGLVALSNGGQAQLVYTANGQSTGGGHDRKAAVAKHTFNVFKLTYYAPDGMIVNVTATYRNFFESGTNDLKASYTATMNGALLGTATLEGHVAAGTYVINKTNHVKYITANGVTNTIQYSHTGPYVLSTASIANIAFFTGGASNTIASVSGTYLGHRTCPPAPPCNNLITVTNADGQPVSTVAIGDTVTVKADFSSIDGVKSVFVVAFPLVEGNDDPGTLGAVNGSVFEQTITIPATAPVGQVILMAVAFDSEYVIGKDGQPSPAGKALASATHLLEITGGPTVPAMTVSVNGKTAIDGATFERGSMLDIAVDFSSAPGVTSTSLFLIDKASGQTTQLGRSSSGPTLTYTHDTTNDMVGDYTLRAEATGTDRTAIAEFNYTLSEPQIP